VEKRVHLRANVPRKIRPHNHQTVNKLKRLRYILDNLHKHRSSTRATGARERTLESRAERQMSTRSGESRGSHQQEALENGSGSRGT
jgi:hypothetical protein